MNLCRDFFEAGLKSTNGYLVGAANRGKAFKFLFGNAVTGDNYFGDGIVFEDFLYGIYCSKDGISIDLLALVSKIIIDKTNGLQIQSGIIEELLKGINATLPDSIDQDVSPLEMILCGLEMLKDAKRTPCSNYKKEKKIEINDQRSPAGDTKALTVIFFSAFSAANTRVKPNKPDFDAE